METEESLLLTKLFVPQVRPNRVARPGLVARLNQALSGKLTLVSAPAGFGKTTLVADWLQQVDRPCTWLSLDDGDNDPNRFLAYLAVALQRINSGWSQTVQESLRSPQPPVLTAMAVTLINEIATSDFSFVLVLDDYHLISAPAVHDVLSFLLDNLPPQMHLVLLSRADPPLPLARLRACSELTEVRADDLRFTLEEAMAFLNEVMNLGLTQQQIAVLERRTEGWVAGLQLAGLSLQGLPPGEAGGFVETFAGSHRYLVDYLVEEVFGRQPRRVQEFLLQTSILDRLCGPLCDAVTDQDDGQATLEWLDAASLFVVPLDHERRWYRYHHLFADLLRDRLRQTQPELVSTLHCRAAYWCEHNGFMEDAVQHALAGEDSELAARLVEQVAHALWSRSEVLTVLRWLKAIPQAILCSRPFLCVGYAWALTLTGQLDAIEPLLHVVEGYLERGAQIPPGSWTLPPDLREVGATFGVEDETGLVLQRLQIVVDMLRASAARLRWDIPGARAFSARALDQISTGDLYLRGMALLFQGHAYLLDGDVEAADRSLVEASRASRATGHAGVYLSATHYLAQLRVLQGRLRDAMAAYQQAAQFVAEQQKPSLAGIERIGIGSLLCEWGDLEAASRYIQEGILLAEVGGDFTFLQDGYIARARLEEAWGHWNDALIFVDKAEQTMCQGQSAGHAAWFDARRIRSWIARGELSAAMHWARVHEPNLEGQPGALREFGHLMLARVLLAQGSAGQAARLLQASEKAAEAGGRLGRVIECLSLQALARQASGDVAGALAALGRALTLAGPEGYMRTFVDEGAPMAALLRLCMSQGIARNYVSRLLAAFGEPVAVSPLIEPLTRREFEVLRLVAAGLKNQEIADRLVISVATVKRHITNIYGKLGVSRRVQAIARAQGLGLL